MDFGLAPSMPDEAAPPPTGAGTGVAGSARHFGGPSTLEAGEAGQGACSSVYIPFDVLTLAYHPKLTPRPAAQAREDMQSEDQRCN